MKKFFLLLGACSLLIISVSCVNVSYNGHGIVGNGVMKEEVRNVSDYCALNVSSSIDVYISDAATAVTVSGDENLMEYVETEVSDSTLNIRFKKGNYSSKKGVKVTVPNSGKINMVTTKGSSDVHVDGTLVADNIRLNCKGSSDFKGNLKAHSCNLSLSGSSDFKGNVETATCDISCTGSSDCIITGKADECNVNLSGSSDLKGYDFIVEKMDALASGSSDVQITCNQELNVKASGSSNVNYKGDAKVVSQKLSGSSDLNKK